MSLRRRLELLEQRLTAAREVRPDSTDDADAYARFLRGEGAEPRWRAPLPWQDAADWESRHQLSLGLALRVRGDLPAGAYPPEMNAADRQVLDGYLAAIEMVCTLGSA